MRESSAAAAEFVEHGESGESSFDADHGLDGAETSLWRVIDTIPALAWCARPDGWMEYVNKRWRDYTGLSPAETVGYGYQAAFHPEDQKDKGERCKKMFSQDGPSEGNVRLRRHDGVYRWFLVRIEPLRDETGRITRWYGTSTDIEYLKQTQEKLEEDQRELRRIVDAIPQAIVVQDPERQSPEE